MDYFIFFKRSNIIFKIILFLNLMIVTILIIIEIYHYNDYKIIILQFSKILKNDYQIDFYIFVIISILLMMNNYVSEKYNYTELN